MENKRTNIVKRGTSTNGRYPVNDAVFRIILTPVFGIIIPIATGMINGRNFTNLEVKLSFIYTIMIAFVIWEGNRYLHFTLRTYFDWINKPLQKIGVLMLTIFFYTVPASVLLLVGWYKLFTREAANWQIITQSTLIILIAVVFITHVYETVFLVKESEDELFKSEQLQRAKAEAELKALQNQIDPHFIFNSLNTLSYLIDEKSERARLFNDNLAEVYRYILQNRARDLVLLREELDFVNSYFHLIRIRFDDAVRLRFMDLESLQDDFLIPPISLQLLLENAVKHNEFSASLPLELVCHFSSGKLYIENTIQPKSTRKPSSQVGLLNLEERYRLITGQGIIVTKTQTQFKVELPLLKNI